jgi:tRNA(Ile)-lysidine synthase
LREYAVGQNIPFREDASNACLDFQRNRIRHELLPLLRRKYQPALDKTILRAMDIAGAEAEFVTEAADDWLRQKCPAPFEDLPVAVQRRCVQLQLLGQGIAPDYDLVERLRTRAGKAVSVGGTGQFSARNETGGTAVPLLAIREAGGIVHLQRAGTPEFGAASMEVALEGRAGEAVFEGTRIGWRIDSKKAAQRKSRAGQEVFDAEKVGSPIVLRHWQPGDRFQPIGMRSAMKLQDFFTNQKVPRSRRHELIVAATGQGELFWVEGLRIAERFKLTKNTNRCLHWAWQRL